MERLQEKAHHTPQGLTYRYFISPRSTPPVSRSTPAILLLHGFPDSAYAWSLMVPYLTVLPNQLIVPDLLGYGQTSKPTDPTLFSYDLMTADLISILDSEYIPSVVSVGHDVGSILAQRLYNFHPNRVCALITLNVPYLLPDPVTVFDLDKANEMSERTLGYPHFEYWNFFVRDLDAARIVEQNLDKFWEVLHHNEGSQGMFEFFCMPGKMKKYLIEPVGASRKDLADYAKAEGLKEEWKKALSGGLESPFCWYRMKTDDVVRKAEAKIQKEDYVVRVPLLFVCCSDDVVCRPEFADAARQGGYTPNFEMDVLDGVGHWSMYEAPQRVAGCIVRFLGRHVL